MRIDASWIPVVAAGMIWVIAWRVRSRQRIELINMIDTARVTDRAGLARFAGNILYPIGAVVGIGGLGLERLGLSENVIGSALAVVILALTLWLYSGARRYTKPR